MKMAKYALLTGLVTCFALRIFADAGPCQLASPPSPFPIPMNNAAQPHGSNFFQTDGYNVDGTAIANPLVSVAPVTVDGVQYLRKKLSSSDSVTFQGQSYPVYSAVPENMTIPYAAQNIAQYFDPATFAANFPNPPQLVAPSTLSQLLATKTATQVPGDNSSVLIVQNNIFLPNLASSANTPQGLTENIYWTVDPWMDNPNAMAPSVHMLPYGWALDALNVQKGVTFPSLINGGIDNYVEIPINNAAPSTNYWKNILSLQPASLTQITTDVKNNPSYPFPAPVWLKNGVYLPVQPMPGFQRNLIRCYTPWGSWNLLNNTSGLFVRQDGSIEFPLATNGQPYPVVIQTWDDDQRYTLLNQTDGLIPSTQDQYPGNENYFASNAYLPSSAGVINSYKDFTIFDNLTENGITNNAGQAVHYLTPRQSDIWLGLKGDKVNYPMTWDKADNTEPGGQANKPYMMGADTSHNSSNGYLYYNIRLEHSNSFMIARLTKDLYANKLYAAALYVDLGDGQGYQKMATLSYQWQPWTIDDNGNWAKSSDDKGAWVPIISDVTKNNVLNQHIVVAQGTGWQPANRNMPWNGLGVYKDDNTQINKLGGPLYFYNLTFSQLNQEDNSPQAQAAAKIKYLVVLTAPSTPVNPTTFTVVPPVNTAISVVQGNTTLTKPPYVFTVNTVAPKTEEVDIKGILAGNNLTCKLAINTTQWQLQTNTCTPYFTASNGGPGNIAMQLPTPPPPAAVHYTLVPPKMGMPVVASMAGRDISFTANETLTINPGAGQQITISKIGDNDLTPTCTIAVDTTGWKLMNPSDCTTYFAATSGAPNSNITLITANPINAAGYYELIPNFHSDIQKPDSIQVTTATGVNIVQPQTPPPPGAVILAVTAAANAAANVQVTVTNAADPTKTASCTLAMSSASWQVAASQASNADCSKFPVSGAVGATLTAPGVIGISSPDKTVGPPQPAGAGYYMISPGQGDTLDVSGAGVNLSGITSNTTIAISSGTVKDNTANTMTIKITGPNNSSAICQVMIGTDTWKLVGTCNYLSPPVNAATSAGTSNTAIIGVGVPQ